MTEVGPEPEATPNQVRPQLRRPWHLIGQRFRSEQGEMSSWLIVGAGLAAIAIGLFPILQPIFVERAEAIASGTTVAAGPAPSDTGSDDTPADPEARESDARESEAEDGTPAESEPGDSEAGDADEDRDERAGRDDRQVPDRGDANDGVDGRVDDRDARDDGRPVEPGGSDDATGTDGTVSDPTSGAQGLPDPPAPPPQPEVGDGSGEHGAEDGIRDRISAEVTETLAYRLADAADTLGLDNASKNMRHYLDNSGDDLIVSPTEIMRDVPQFEQVVTNTIQFDLRADIDAQIAANWDGEPISFQATTDWETFNLAKDLSKDWFYGLGGISYAVGAEVTVVPGADGTPQVSVNYQTHVFDRYNWDGGKAVTIGPITITDERLGQLHEVGIAHEYDVFGTSDAQDFSYEYDPAGATPTTEVDPSNGEGR